MKKKEQIKDPINESYRRVIAELISIQGAQARLLDAQGDHSKVGRFVQKYDPDHYEEIMKDLKSGAVEL